MILYVVIFIFFLYWFWNNFSVRKFYLGTLLFIFINAVLGPFEYNIKFYNVIVLLITVICVHYLSSLPKTKFTIVKIEEYNGNVIFVFKFLAILSFLLFFSHQFVTYGTFFISDLSEVRDSLGDNVSWFKRFAEPMSGFFIYYSIYSLSKRLNILNLFLFSSGYFLLDLFYAGRQYTLLFLIVLLSFIFFNKRTMNYFQFNSKNIYIFIFISIIFILIVSFFRSLNSENVIWSNRFEMYSYFSNIRYKSSWSDLPDLFIDYFYYFGAQLAKLSELLSLNKFQFINIEVWKFNPFLERNIFFMFTNFTESNKTVYGQIHAFTWNTSFFSSLTRYGFLGFILVETIFSRLVKSFDSRKYYFKSDLHIMIILISISFYTAVSSIFQSTPFLIYFLIVMFNVKIIKNYE